MPTKSPKLNEKDQKDLDFFLVRKKQLEEARTNSGMEVLWRQADADYLPHKLGKSKKKVLVENERTEVSSYVSLEKDQWRSKEAKNDPYIKIQTALSIILDRNPEAVFDPGSKRFEANNIIIEKLYHRTWTDTNIGAKKELKKFIFNLSKYGWAPARRYYKRVVRKDMQAIEKYNLQTQEFEYKSKEMVDVDDVFFEALNPFNAWIDDMAKPDDPRRRDWMWCEVFDEDGFYGTFGEDKRALNIQFGSIVYSDVNGQEQKKQFTSDKLVKVFFYENRMKDKFLVMADNKLVKVSPLMTENKELSLVDTYWTMRDAESPYGIGINEIMRNNKVMLDRIRNMTIDQVTLSIYKMFFYANSEQLDDEGGEQISIEPGKGKKVIDPKNITWMDVPGPGKDAYELLEILRKDMEDDTGITRTLEGEITGKTAFEISQAQQGALKRLKLPLGNIKSALEWDAKLCVSLMKMIYSVPKVYSLIDPELIANYVASTEADGDRYYTDESGVFNALKYREFQLSIEADPQGNFQASEDKKFFQVKPKYLDWEGEITIRVDSMIEQSRPLERQAKLELSNILLPLLAAMAQAPAMFNAYIRPVKQLLKIYDENPTDWLPEEWLSGQPIQMQPEQPQPEQPLQAEKLAPAMEQPMNEMNLMQSQSQSQSQ